MAFTKTVNYIQNVPISLGYANEVSGTTGTVRAVITFNNKAGRLTTGTYGSSKSKLVGTGAQQTFANTWEIEGTEADVNSALNDLSWLPKAYDDAAIAQDFLSEDRLIDTYQGELLLDSEYLYTTPAWNVGDQVRLFAADENAGSFGEYTISRVDPDGKRIYVTYNDDYKITDDYGMLRPEGDTRAYNPYILYTTVIRTGSGSFRGYLRDMAIINPHGQYFLNVQIFDNDVLYDSGTTTLDGELFVKEPTFTVLPPASISSNGAFSWTDELEMGQIAQPDNEKVSVQLLIKRHVNDPAFDGSASNNKPSYVSDNTYGAFSEVRVEDRISEIYDDGVVRWSFYGTPDQCNKALNDVRFYDANAGDFFVETRIVNGRARIYSDRGYD